MIELRSLDGTMFYVNPACVACVKPHPGGAHACCVRLTTGELINVDMPAEDVLSEWRRVKGAVAPTYNWCHFHPGGR